MSKLQVIVASTRPTRAADLVVPWVLRRAGEHPGLEPELVDLRDWPLPMFAEHPGTLGSIKDPTYSEPIVRRWNDKVREADAYLVITPEYNHSIPGVLKNAIDTVWFSFAFRLKPMAAVGYSSGTGAGIRAIEHLVQVALEAELVPLRSSVVVPSVSEAFAHGGPKDPMTDARLDVALDDLAWWAELLARARADGAPAPAAVRLMAARQALEGSRGAPPQR